MTEVRVLHVGNETADGAAGGIAAVIRTLVATAPYPARAVATYWPTTRWRPRRLLQAATAVLRAPAGTVVHAHLSEGGSWVREGAFVLLSRLSGKPVAVTLHGALLAEWIAHPLPRALVRAVLRLPHVAFALHDGDVALVRQLSSTPVLPIANPMGPASGEATDDGATVLFAGEQSHRKGVDVLAAAWTLVLARRPDARLLVAGPARGVEVGGPGVVNLGAIPPARVRELMRGASIVVLPSRAEALPMVLLEAMAEGKPFVASSVAGIPRLASTGAGLLVPPGDAGALADALVRLLGDPAAREAAGKAAHRWWAEHAAPAAVHAELIEGYRLALRRRARGRSR